MVALMETPNRSVSSVHIRNEGQSSQISLDVIASPANLNFMNKLD